MTNTVNPCHTFDTFRNSFINNLYGNYSQIESSHSKRIFLIIAMIKIRLVLSRKRQFTRPLFLVYNKRIFLIIEYMIKIRLVDIYSQESGNSRGLYFLFINTLTNSNKVNSHYSNIYYNIFVIITQKSVIIALSVFLFIRHDPWPFLWRCCLRRLFSFSLAWLFASCSGECCRAGTVRTLQHIGVNRDVCSEKSLVSLGTAVNGH